MVKSRTVNISLQFFKDQIQAYFLIYFCKVYCKKYIFAVITNLDKTMDLKKS